DSSFGQTTLAHLIPLSTNVAVSAAATDNGIGLQFEGIPNAGSPSPTAAANPGSAIDALEHLPPQTIVAVAGDSVASTLDDADRSLKAALRATLGAFAPDLGIDTRAWSAGEFALGLTRGDVRATAQNGQTGRPDSLLVARVNNGATTARDLAKFDFVLRP